MKIVNNITMIKKRNINLSYHMWKCGQKMIIESFETKRSIHNQIHVHALSTTNI